MFKYVAALMFAALLFFSATPSAEASEYEYDGKYYWRAGVAYYDTGYWYQQYYTAYTYSACGCYKYPYYTYKWVWYPVYTPVKLDVKAKDIDEQLVDMAIRRDAKVLAMAARDRKAANTLALADKLGLNVAIPNYGEGVFPLTRLGSYSSSYHAGQTAALVVPTVYFQQTVDAFNQQLDVNGYMGAAAKYIERSQEVTAVADGNFSARIAQAMEGQRAVAEINAKAAGAIAFAKAVAPSPSTKIETRVLQFGTVKAGPGPDAPVQPQAQLAFHRIAVVQSCIECHSGPKAQGAPAFDITRYHPATATPEEEDRVLKYLTNADPKKRCPKDGEALTEAQVAVFRRQQQ